MKAIRGATTVTMDGSEEIKSAVKELMDEITRSNSLDYNDVVSVIFTNTADIHSYYPAKACREAGYFQAPLFSALEPQIDGALEKCIRVLILTNSDRKPIHIYLRGAKILRRDVSEVINIAVDGPAGSGKSTVCKEVARRLDILCLDTGAMYRACALAVLRNNADIKNEKQVENVVKTAKIEVKYQNGNQRTFLNGEDVSEEIRKNEISMLASCVSAFEFVRNKMVALQREIAQKTSCILDGRDIGTNVLPCAKFKFYITASSEVRAKRRYDELISKGQKVDLKDLESEIIKRDEQDKNRANAPLRQAVDAELVDTSNMSAEEVIQYIINRIQGKI